MASFFSQTRVFGFIELKKDQQFKPFQLHGVELLFPWSRLSCRLIRNPAELTLGQVDLYDNRAFPPDEDSL